MKESDENKGINEPKDDMQDDGSKSPFKNLGYLIGVICGMIVLSQVILNHFGISFEVKLIV